jgi:fatty-acyl-CoA synthase
VSPQTGADDDLEHRTRTIGCVHPHLEIRIADPSSGRTQLRGVAGELQTRGYSVMLGYWNEPERTAEAIDAARWMHTGDLAVMADDGYVQIVGRIKDMIIRGGENVYPREIEEYLHTHPAIAEAQVVGVPDAKYGEEVMAWVKLRAGAAPLSEDDVLAYCRGQLAHYKVPRYARVVAEFPMTVTGKVQKYKLRELAIAELGLAAAAAIETA